VSWSREMSRSSSTDHTAERTPAPLSGGSSSTVTASRSWRAATSRAGNPRSRSRCSMRWVRVSSPASSRSSRSSMSSQASVSSCRATASRVAVRRGSAIRDRAASELLGRAGPGWQRGRVAPRIGPAHPHRAGAPRPTGPGHRAARGGDAGGSAAQSLQPGGARRLLHAQQPIQVVALLSSGRAASSVCSCCVACSRTVVMSRSQAGSG